MHKEEQLELLNNYNKNTLMETLEIKFTAIEKNSLTASMPVSSKVHQPLGLLHGGATAALAETVGSCASTLVIDSKTQTIKGIELSINHVKSKKDGTVFATAKLIHKGKTTHLWEVRIVDENNSLISLCKITNIVLNK